MNVERRTSNVCLGGEAGDALKQIKTKNLQKNKKILATKFRFFFVTTLNTFISRYAFTPLANSILA